MHGWLDIAALVARRNHNRHGFQIVIIDLWQRAAYRIVTQCEHPESRKNADEPVHKPADSKQRNRHQQPLLGLHRVEIRKTRYGLNVRRREHILRRMRHPLPGPLDQLQNRIPKVREIANHQSRFARTQGMQQIEERLTIVERADCVDNQDIVERPFELS